MKLNEINEIGFYRAINDEKPDYIFEVIKNTDKEWLKNTPEQKFLIDEWIFDYIDKDDKYYYGCAGNLVAIQNAYDIEVVKITDKKYKIEGNCGEYLVEDKLTYKEKYAQLKEENARLKEELNTYKKIWNNPEVHIALTDVRTGERKLWYENCIKYKQTLNAIKEIAETAPALDTELSQRILEVIKESEEQ